MKGFQICFFTSIQYNFQMLPKIWPRSYFFFFRTRANIFQPFSSQGLGITPHFQKLSSDSHTLITWLMQTFNFKVSRESWTHEVLILKMKILQIFSFKEHKIIALFKTSPLKITCRPALSLVNKQKNRIVKPNNKLEDFHTLFTLINILFTLVIRSIHYNNTKIKKTMWSYPIEKD